MFQPWRCQNVQGFCCSFLNFTDCCRFFVFVSCYQSENRQGTKTSFSLSSWSLARWLVGAGAWLWSDLSGVFLLLTRSTCRFDMEAWLMHHGLCYPWRQQMSQRADFFAFFAWGKYKTHTQRGRPKRKKKKDARRHMKCITHKHILTRCPHIWHESSLW